MKREILIVILTVITQLCSSQTVDFDLIKYKGLNFYSSKSEITQKLGAPHKIFEPNYECGFLSSEEQMTEYYSLDYGNLKFTGNAKESYLLEDVEFGNDCSTVLNYGKYKLTCKTDLAELEEIFGDELKKHFGGKLDGGIILYHGKADDGIRLEIKEGKLVKFGYWSPC